MVWGRRAARGGRRGLGTIAWLGGGMLLLVAQGALAGGTPARFVPVVVAVALATGLAHTRWPGDCGRPQLHLRTGIPNRAWFLERLEQVASRSARHDSAYAVLFIDLDGFKAVNDRHGHDVGDRLLVEVGERLAHVVRAEETLARLGGDEFTVLL